MSSMTLKVALRSYGSRESRFEIPAKSDDTFDIEVETDGIDPTSVYDSLFNAIPKQIQIRYLTELFRELLTSTTAMAVSTASVAMETANCRRDLNNVKRDIRITETNDQEFFDVLRTEIRDIHDNLDYLKEDDTDRQRVNKLTETVVAGDDSVQSWANAEILSLKNSVLEWKAEIELAQAELRTAITNLAVDTDAPAPFDPRYENELS